MRRKRYTQEFKDQVIKEALETGNSAIVARRYELSGSLVARWVREFKNGKQNANSANNLSFSGLARENQHLSAYFGLIRTPIPETSGQRNGCIRTLISEISGQ